MLRSPLSEFEFISYNHCVYSQILSLFFCLCLCFVCLSLFLFLGFGILPITLMGEMFTINVRGKGSAITLGCSWLIGFGLTTAFAYIIKTLGAHVLFWFFSVSCACACVFTKCYIPETKGKSLLEIQQFMGKKPNENISI